MAYENTYAVEFAKKIKGKENLSEYLDQELEALKERIITLDSARKEMAKGFDVALKALQKAYPQIDLQDPNYTGTPDRMARAFIEMCTGLGVSQEEIFSTSFPIGKYDEVVVLKNIEYTSLCCHHFFPFVGQAHIGYIPGDQEADCKVVGLSKLARIVDMHAKRPQLQEKMCNDIRDAISNELKPAGTIVMVEGKHNCLACRGPKKPDASMVTTSMDGRFKQSVQLRSEFLTLIGLNNKK